MGDLNLGILAHVDAGKTTPTERLLYAAGVIDEIGRVDDGTTQTDTLALEKRRGITIKSAVVSFAVGGVTINLIDTPGHPDFVAEVGTCWLPRACWRARSPRPGSTSCGNERRRSPAEKACSSAASKSTATGGSAARSRPVRGRTRTRWIARNTCFASRGGSSEEGRRS